MSWQQSGPREAHALTASDLKLCDLCGALNLASNRECFVCRWRGRFERREDIVTMAMELASRKYGCLESWQFSGSPFADIGLRRSFRSRLVGVYLRLRDWLLR